MTITTENLVERELDKAFVEEHGLKCKFVKKLEKLKKLKDLKKLEDLKKKFQVLYALNRKINLTEKEMEKYQRLRAKYGMPGYHIAPHVYQVFPSNESGELFFSRGLGNEAVHLTGYYKLVVVCNDDDTLSYYADLEDDPANDAKILANRPEHRPYAINHSDMVCGASVVFSGYVALDEIGQLNFLSNESGHYKFTLEESENFCRYLIQQFNLANICLHDYSQEPGLAYYSLILTNSGYADPSDDSSDKNMLDSVDNLSMASSGYSLTIPEKLNVSKNISSGYSPIIPEKLNVSKNVSSGYSPIIPEKLNVSKNVSSGSNQLNANTKQVNRRGTRHLLKSSRMTGRPRHSTTKHPKKRQVGESGFKNVGFFAPKVNAQQSSFSDEQCQKLNQVISCI